MHCGDAQTGRCHRPDHDRNVILRGSGVLVGISQAAANLEQDLFQLLHSRLVTVPRELCVLVLGSHVTRAEPKFKATGRQEVGRGSGPREQRGIPESDVQDVRAQTHPGAHLAGRGQRCEWVRSAQMIRSGDQVAAERLRAVDHLAKRRDPQGDPERDAGHNGRITQPHGCRSPWSGCS